MRLTLVAALVMSGLAARALPGLRALEPSQDQAARFQASSAELVVLPVTVTDRRGGFITDLTRDRFAVIDNGQLQDVTLFSNEDTPVTVGLVIDDSGSMRPKIGEVIVAATAFARLSNPADELFTVAFNDTVLESDSGHQPMTAGDGKALETALKALVPQGRTALYDALVAALDRVERGRQARKALVVLSDGGDNASRATLKDVMARARRTNVTIFTIGLFDDEDPDRNPGVLKALAESTGGTRFLPRSPSLLIEACERIARELRSGYTLGFVPPRRDGAFHRIRVKVALPDGGKVSVRTRPGYFAATETRAAP